MGKKWKKRLQQRQNQLRDEEDVQLDFPQEEKKDVHSRLGWKKKNNSNKKQKDKQKGWQKAAATLNVNDVDMGSSKNRY